MSVPSTALGNVTNITQKPNDAEPSTDSNRQRPIQHARRWKQPDERVQNENKPMQALLLLKPCGLSDRRRPLHGDGPGGLAKNLRNAWTGHAQAPRLAKPSVQSSAFAISRK